MKISKAKYGDLEQICELYKKAIAEIGDTYKDELVRQKVYNAYFLAPCFIIQEDDRITAMAGLTMGLIPYNGNLTLTDYMFYIEPEYRNLKRFGGLVKSSKRFADDMNLPLRLDFITPTISEDLKKRVFDMHKFNVTGVSGIWEKAAVE